MTELRRTFSALNERDRMFLSRLSRSIRENSTGFEFGGKLIDARFSLRPMQNGNHEPVSQVCNGAFKSPEQRLMDAVRWAAQPTAGADTDELQAICILTWLAYDKSAHLVEKVLCDLQLIPWRPVLGDVDRDPRGPLALWGSREAVSLQVFDYRLVAAARRSAAKLDATESEDGSPDAG
jgi:hypothetical protein